MESVRTQYVTVKEIFKNCPKLKKGSTWRKIPEIAQLGEEKKGKKWTKWLWELWGMTSSQMVA